MKNAYEVLSEREAELARLRKEIESLNIVARLLADDDDERSESGRSADSNKVSSPLSETISRLSDTAASNAENMFSSAQGSRQGFWSVLKRAT